MVHRPGVLLVVLCVLLAGCVATGPSRTGSPGSGTPGTAGTTPDGCAQEDRPTARAYPDRPDEVTRRTALEYAVDHRTATVWNGRLDPGVLHLSVSVTNATVVDETETGFVVAVRGGWSVERCHDGQRVHGMGGFGANYFVNDTVVVALERPRNHTTDPRNGGTVVERWDDEG